MARHRTRHLATRIARDSQEVTCSGLEQRVLVLECAYRAPPNAQAQRSAVWMPHSEGTLSFRLGPLSLSEATPRSRCSLLLEADHCHNAFAGDWNCLDQTRHKWQEIGQAIATRLDQDDSQAVLGQMLLK